MGPAYQSGALGERDSAGATSTWRLAPTRVGAMCAPGAASGSYKEHEMAVVAISTPPLSAPGSSHVGDRASFAEYVFDVVADQLFRGSTAVKLSPKALLLLRFVVHNPGRVLKKDALMAAIWASTVVTENSLVQLVVELRNALGDKEQRIIKTVPRRGYLFAAEVKWQGQEPPLRTDAGTSPRYLLGSFATLASLAMVLTASMPHRTGSVDDESARAFPVFVESFVEGDANGSTSRAGRRIADDVSALLLQRLMHLATPENGAKLAITGRLLRRTPNGITVDAQVRDLSSGESHSLVQLSFASEDELVISDLPLRMVRAMVDRRNAIILARARQPGHQPDAMELLHLAWDDYWLAKTETDLARASARFEAVLQQDATSVSARFGRSVSCYRTFSHLFSPAPLLTLAECERQIRELYSRAPESTDTLQAMGPLLQTLGKPEQAVWLLRKSIDLSPSDRTTNQLMAMVLVKEGRFEEAAPYLEFTRLMAERRREHGVSDHRRQAFFYQLFSDKAVLQGHEEESRAWLLRWSAEYPHDGRPYLTLAAIDAVNGRIEEAKSNMARHRQLVPRSNLRYVEML